MKVNKICLKRLLWTSVSIFLGMPTTVFAGQYQYCYPVTQYRTVRDPAYHPQAYEDGYREGANVARKYEKYEPRTVGGEFARGFDEGYEGRPLAGQRNTIADRQESYETSQCRNYYYNEKDPINEILRNVMSDFERDLRRDWHRLPN
jgi:hypothetical protein